MTDNEDYSGVSAIAAPSGTDWSTLPLNVGPPPGAPEGNTWGSQPSQGGDNATSVDGTEHWGNSQPAAQASVNWGEVKVEENEIREEFRQPMQREVPENKSSKNWRKIKIPSNEMPMMDPMRQQPENLTPQMAEQVGDSERRITPASRTKYFRKNYML